MIFHRNKKIWEGIIVKKVFLTLFATIIALVQFSIVSAAPNLSYVAYVQDSGWLREVSEGDVAGTTGRNKRLEALVINLDDNGRSAVEYCAHVENMGWQAWKSSGDIAGTTQRSLRMEAIKIRLTGRYAERYDIYYRVHVGDIGWMDWVRNGDTAGTVGESRRIEAIQIRLEDKRDRYSNNRRYDRDRYNNDRYENDNDDDSYYARKKRERDRERYGY